MMLSKKAECYGARTTMSHPVNSIRVGSMRWLPVYPFAGAAPDIISPDFPARLSFFRQRPAEN
jgi:hypothetical protein